MGAACCHYRQECQRMGKRLPILPIKHFYEQIVEHGPQPKTADGEDYDRYGYCQDEAALGTTETTRRQRPDFGIPFGFIDQFPLYERFFILVVTGNVSSRYRRAMPAAAIGGAPVSICTPAMDVVSCPVLRANDNLIAWSKRLFTEGTALPKKRRALIDQDGSDGHSLMARRRPCQRSRQKLRRFNSRCKRRSSSLRRRVRPFFGT